MSDPLAKAAAEWFQKGTEAMQRENWDFAVECFGSAVKMKPDVVLYRQTKHGCSRKMYDDNGSGAKMAGMKLMKVRGKIKKANAKSQWKDVVQQAEDGLCINPWDAALFASLGNAAAELEWGEIAQYALSKAVEIERGNIDYNRALGHVLLDRGEYKKAEACFKRIYDVDSTDGDARAMMNKIAAMSVMDRGNYEKAESTQQVKIQEEKTNAYEEDRRARRGKGNDSVAPGESVEADLRNAIRKEPQNLAYYHKLAEHLREERKLPQTIEIIDQALKVSSNELSFIELKEDVELDIMREKAADAAERYRRKPDRERLKEKAITLRKEVQEREIEIFAKRVESPNHKNDMKMKFELAQRYRKAGKLKEAVPLFQQSVADTRLKEDALVGLGECFIRTGKMDLGVKQLQKALETLSDSEESFKLAHYLLGRVYQKNERNEEAAEHYGAIYGKDVNYKDVGERLDEVSGGAEDEFADMDDDDF